MISSLSRRSAAGLALVVCGAAATTCGAPSHTFYDDTNSVAATGTGGAGGTDATSGAAGSSSTGSAGSLTGSGGSMDTTGVGSSTGGSGGDASTGAAGSTGTAGGTSSGGAGGNTTGSAGAAGMGGKSDGGATGGAAGSAGGKADAGPENCFDNIDNNGDSLIDCADPLCAPVGTCVTEEPNHALGVLVDAAAPCPAGTTATAINRGVTGGACTGCTCAPVAMTCSADVFTYDTAAQCSSDTGLTLGTNVGRLTGPCVQTTTQPIFQGNKAGVRVALNAGPAQCSRGGTPSLAPPTWTSSKKLCTYPSRGGGCVAGKRCVPVQTDAATQCSLAAGATATCSGFGTTQNDWYSSFTDGRSCGACGCVAMGGACQNARVQFGSDYVCTDSLVTVNAGAKSCTGTSYSPPAGFLFTAVNPTCTASAMVNGVITPTGPQTLCCTPR